MAGGAAGELEENVAKLEKLFGPDGHVGLVGQSEGKEPVATPDPLEKIKQPGKPEESFEANAGKINAHDERRELEENVRKLEESFGPDGHVGIVGETEGKHVKCVIELASKGSEQEVYIGKLKDREKLQLPDGAVVVAMADASDVSVAGGFDVHLYLENLQTFQFGKLVVYSPLIPSTHTLLSQNFHHFPPGALCVADAQLQGKGRGGNVWQSPRGCLAFSFTIQMTNGRLVPFLQYVVSLAVVEAVEDTCKSRGLPAPELKIKWPNDLYAKGLKIGGVLCTSSYRDKNFNIVVGVGLNVGNREPTTCLDALIQELDEQSPALKQEELLARIMLKFETLNTIFQDQGFLPLQSSYYSKWLHSGQSVILEEKDQASSNVSCVPVTIQGLTPTGYLLASDDVGEQYELHPDGNSFDFLKGLVRQKLTA